MRPPAASRVAAGEWLSRRSASGVTDVLADAWLSAGQGSAATLITCALAGRVPVASRDAAAVNWRLAVAPAANVPTSHPIWPPAVRAGAGPLIMPPQVVPV